MSEFKRKILYDLEEWRVKDNRKPLVLRGARQVGKTTIVKMFAKQFKGFISLNLEIEKERELFLTGMDVEKTISKISFYSGVLLDSGVLLFIDEIQNEPQAVQMLRYFYEQHPEICVISAGSLLESYVGRTFSFPVGRVEYMYMYPCSFYEYMEAMSENFDLQTIYEGNHHFIHERLMDHFQTYTLLGGMPEVIQQYASTKNLREVESIYSTLLASYQDDVEKYASNKTQMAIIRHILQYGWASAAEIITFERFAGSTYKSREMKEAFLTLQKSMLLETVYPTNSVRMPLQEQFSKHPKLFWLDTGIVNFVATVRDELFGAKDIQDVYRGRIAEHIVGQELLTISNMPNLHRSFWFKNDKSEAEVDLLYVYNGYVVPVEVKSGVNSRLKSLQSYMAVCPHDVAVRVWSKPLSIDEVKNPISGKMFRLINLPFYLVGLLPKILNSYLG
ncbi:MAG: ATP-binding protein [Paludibacteraceae bacterium]|nr:ATP-binding protein [Paludibacteraceae bacterium]